MSILNTSVSGMLANSNWLSSISQNVANANTTGYKNLETEFLDPGRPGRRAERRTAPGVQTSTMSLNTIQGSIVTSQTSTNLAVQGAGFFVVSNATGTSILTRNGSFVPDASGNLVNSAGYYLMGSNVQNGQSTARQLAEQPAEGQRRQRRPDRGADHFGVACGQSAFDGDGDRRGRSAATNSTTPTLHRPDVARCVRRPRRRAHDQHLFRQDEGAGTWEVDAYDASTRRRAAAFPIRHGPLATQTLTFSSTRRADESGSPLTFTVPGGQSTSLDLGNMTQLATSFSVTSATANGNAPASLQGVSIGRTEPVSYNYSNGASVAAYDIPLANVESPDNLTSVSGNAYTANVDSGPIFLGSAEHGELRRDRFRLARGLHRRPRHRTHRHDPGAKRLSKPTPRSSRRGRTSSTSSTT